MSGVRSHRAVAVLAVLCPGLLAAQQASSELETHYRRAQQAQERRQYAQAAEEWEAIVKLAPRMAEARSIWG